VFFYYGFQGAGLSLNPTMAAMGFVNNMNPNYQFLMRFNELSNKMQPGNQNMGYGAVSHNNFLQPSVPNMSQSLTTTTPNNDLMTNFNWVQYAQLLSCGSLGNMGKSI